MENKVKYLEHTEVETWELRKRINLINSVVGFKSVCLIGTTNSLNQNNVAIFNSLVHIGANPPLIGFITRPDSVERHTLSNIMAHEFYTVNHINEDIYRKAHQTSARYPREISEFEATGLTPDFKNEFYAPFVKESNIQLGVKFKERIDIRSNNTILVIGEIIQLYFPENCLCEDGFIDIQKAQTITGTGLDSYHKTQYLSKLSYAKPDVNISDIPNLL